MASKIAFDFVLEEIAALNPRVKAMFGSHAVYVGDKIFFILRMKDNNTDDNGVWLATLPEHHASLQRDFPSMRSIRMFGPGPTIWQNFPLESADFEESVLKACAFALQGDPRIGKVPAGRKISKKNAAAPKKESAPTRKASAPKKKKSAPKGRKRKSKKPR